MDGFGPKKNTLLVTGSKKLRKAQKRYQYHDIGVVYYSSVSVYQYPHAYMGLEPHTV